MGSFILGLDLAQFIAAGRLVQSGRGSLLYDQAAEYQERVALLGVGRADVFPDFIAPPSLAVLYVPFGWLPFSAAEGVHRVLALGAFGLAMYLVRRWSPAPWWAVAMLGIASPWSLINVQTGQTTPFMVLLWAASARLVAAGKPNWAAGVVGLGLVKPQLVWPGLVLLAVRGGWRGAMLAATAQYLVAWLVTADPLWPRAWLAEAARVSAGIPGGPEAGPVRAALALLPVIIWVGARTTEWRGLATLLLPSISLTFVPYPFAYYWLLGVLPALATLHALGRFGETRGWERLRRPAPGSPRDPETKDVTGASG